MIRSEFEETPYTKLRQLQKELFEASPEHYVQETPIKVDNSRMRMLFEPTSVAAADSFFETENRKYWSVENQKFLEVEKIGKGGSSNVFKVINSSFKQFALKNVNVNSEELPMFIEEIKLLESLSKEERIISLYEYEIDEREGTILMILELGQMDLDKLIRCHLEKGGLEMCYIRVYWKEMLEAVKVVHHHRIVHSDLKPANFILVSGHLKLSDFGIARKIGNDTTHIEREDGVGTLNFMSPEAILVNSKTKSTYKQGRPSDVWSLGCILYKMIYGQPPFHSLNMYQKLQAIPDPTFAINYPNTKRNAMQVMQWCLHRAPEKRPTVTDLINHAFVCE
eukprot:NODE_44_length_33449_cov_1.575742.p12 type:complete len:337 gc:universal NODE_44_length_33449_cov_1.575742:18706-17696(-)